MSPTASDRRIVHSLSLRILDKIEKYRNTIENMFLKEYQKKKFCGFYFHVLEIALSSIFCHLSSSVKMIIAESGRIEGLRGRGHNSNLRFDCISTDSTIPLAIPLLPPFFYFHSHFSPNLLFFHIISTHSTDPRPADVNSNSALQKPLHSSFLFLS